MPTERPSPNDSSGPIVALCGGVGAARFLSGLVRVVNPEDVVAVVNTGDDREFYGVHVSPDLDIVTYTLAGLVDRAQGYGLEGDGYALMTRLEELGHEVWFRLGDRDFAHCLHRTLRMREGAGLASVAAELATAHGVAPRLLPMSEDPCPTLVELDDGKKLHFEEYMIREGAPDRVAAVDLSAAAAAKPGPGVLEAIAAARAIVFCPSNPVVSIGPILAIPGVREALRESEAKTVAISPIVGGAPIKGPASQLLRGIGVEVSAAGVAHHYRELIDAYVLDERDADQLDAVRGLGLAAAATDSIMVDPDAAARLARVALELLETTA
jgi:LPPG:FO 2-phospho-L-lactate transferase